VVLEHVLVDHCALQLMLHPARFDVLLADNLFGDILSDAVGALAGSLAMLPSASFGAARTTTGTGRASARYRGFYEPVHGSAPDIAGLGIANPLGAFLSLALALRWSFGWHDEANLLEQAVTQALAHGARTRDLMPSAQTTTQTQTNTHTPALSTCGMTNAVLTALDGLGGQGARAATRYPQTALVATSASRTTPASVKAVISAALKPNSANSATESSPSCGAARG